MSLVNHISRERQAAVLDEASAALIDAMDVIARKHGLSPLSAATICLQATMLGVKQLGGAASKPYMRLMIDGTFCTDAREGQKITRRAYSFMQSMAQHFNSHWEKMKGDGA